jgi:peroxiredoxin
VNLLIESDSKGTAKGRARIASMTFVLALLLLLAPAQRAPVVFVGSVAPTFTVTDDRGTARSLTDFKGRWVVLEWHEKGCPYVTKHYRSGHMQRLQKQWTDQGVTWLMVTSSADGNHSYLTPDESRAYLAEIKATPTAHLLDVDGKIGRQYGVLTALHMVVIDPAGKVVYNGAIDDKPTTRVEDLAGATNYVQRALTEARAGRPVTPATTEPYGCSIHYSATQLR